MTFGSSSKSGTYSVSGKMLYFWVRKIHASSAIR